MRYVLSKERNTLSRLSDLVWINITKAATQRIGFSYNLNGSVADILMVDKQKSIKSVQFQAKKYPLFYYNYLLFHLEERTNIGWRSKPKQLNHPF